MDLSQFICLQELKLSLSSTSILFDEVSAPLATALSNVASYQLEKLYIYCSLYKPHSLDSTLTALAGLKAVDSILSRPQFRCLTHVRLSFIFYISMQEYPIISTNTSLPMSLGTVTSALVPNSQSGVSHHDSQDDIRDAFKCYAKQLIESKTKEGMKELNSRKVLHTDLHINIEKNRRRSTQACSVGSHMKDPFT